MKALRIFAAMTLACALAACGLATAPDPQSTGSPIFAAADQVTIAGTKGLILAELAYEPVAFAAAAYLENGAATPAQAQKIQQINRDVTAALIAAKSAKTGAEQALQVGKALSGIADLKIATPVPPG